MRPDNLILTVFWVCLSLRACSCSSVLVQTFGGGGGAFSRTSRTRLRFFIASGKSEGDLSRLDKAFLKYAYRDS
jgi:hypothetical protein